MARDGKQVQLHVAGAGWSLIFLATSVSSIVFTFGIVGYRWSAEFAVATLTAVSFVFLLFGRASPMKFGKLEGILVVMPIAAFTAWSAISIAWSDSTRAALHHTLLWGSYLVFLLAIRQLMRKSEIIDFALKFLTGVIFIICAAGLLDYFGTPGPVTYRFTAQYYLYSEAFAAFLPLLLALVVLKQGKWASIAAVTALSTWTLVIATTSRAMFISSCIGIVSFFIIAFTQREFANKKRLLLVIGAFLIITGAFVFLKRSEQVSIADRMLGNDHYAVEAAYSRVYFWGLALEAFRNNPLIGIGSDNFFSNYRQLREGLVVRDGNGGDSLIIEDLIPERAHNEYLQILGELGIVGFGIFCWLIVGIFYISFHFKPQTIIQIAALAGIIAFLASSSVSSYSFRFPTSGLSFFFLVAVFLPEEKVKWTISRSRASLLILLPIMLLAFSTVRGLSVYYFSKAAAIAEPNDSEAELQKAIWLDPTEPMFKAYYGQLLDLWGKPDEAVPNFRYAIDHGIANSTTYFGLCSTYLLLNRLEDADNTFQEATRLYPKSVFLRTAYASFLKRHGRMSDAKVQYQVAESVDNKQAQGWQIAHDEGLARLSRLSLQDPNYVKVENLLPLSGPMVLANYQYLSKTDIYSKPQF